VTELSTNFLFIISSEQTVYTDNREKAGNGVISILASEDMV